MNKEKNKEEADIEAYVTQEQLDQMQKITDEIKRLKGQKMVKDGIEKLNNQLNELKKTHRKEPTNKVVKLWVSGMKKMIKWWTMSDLTPEQREEKRRRFEEAGGNLFGGGSRGEMPNIFGDSGGNNQKMPALFGGSDEHDEMPGFLDEMMPQKQKRTRNTKSKTKSQGKQSKKHTKKQKGGPKWIIRNGKAYPVARTLSEEASYKPKKKQKKRSKQKKATTRRKKEQDDDGDQGMFFDING